MKALHLCIDVQETSYVDQNEWWRMEQAILAFSNNLQQYGVPTLYVGLVGDGPSILGDFISVQGQLFGRKNRITLALPANAFAATKKVYSAQKEPLLNKYIRGLGLSHLFISGAWEARDRNNERSCVSCSAADFRKVLGIKVSIAAEATDRSYYMHQRLPPTFLEERREIHSAWGVDVEKVSDICDMLSEGCVRNNTSLLDKSRNFCVIA